MEHKPISPLQRAADAISIDIVTDEVTGGFYLQARDGARLSEATKYDLRLVRRLRQEMVRAVIEAVREPTQAMLDASGCIMQSWYTRHPGLEVWQDMIDALLKEAR